MADDDRVQQIANQVQNVQLRIEQVQGAVQTLRGEVNASVAALSEQQRQHHAEQMRRFQDVIDVLDVRRELEAVKARLATLEQERKS